MRREECLIWTEDGVWFQSYVEDGGLRLSDLGRISLTSVQDFAEKHAIRLYVKGRKPKALFPQCLSPVAQEELAARGH